MSLSEELAKENLPDKIPRGFGKHDFLSQLNEIQTALDDGYSAKRIWKHLYKNGIIVIKYRAFIGYVNKYASNNQENMKNQKESENKKGPSKEKEYEPKQLKRPLTRTFNYDAFDVPKEELI